MIEKAPAFRLTLTGWLIRMSVLSVLALFVLAVCVWIGPTDVDISRAGFFSGFISALQGRGDDAAATILFRVRLPRVLLAGIVGAALSIAGVSFQAILRNPLAEPFILGVSGGGALGAIIAIMLGLGASVYGVSVRPIFAFIGSLCAVLAVFSIARTHGRLPTHTLLLAGVITNAFLSAIIMFLISVSSQEKVHSMVYWMMGNLSSERYGTVLAICVYVAVGAVILFGEARTFNLLSLGEESAHHLGANVERVKFTAFIAASLVTGAVVSVSGLIGFVGLMVPHITRLMLGPDHRLVLPASVFVGAMFLMICDTAARTLIAPSEIPVGVITAILGGPFFIWLLRRRGAAAFVEA